KTHFFRPGARHWFSWKYPRPDYDHSPNFIISFDADTTGQRYGEDKTLHGFRAPEENYNLGHKYAFRYDGPSKRYIEIYDMRGGSRAGRAGTGPALLSPSRSQRTETAVTARWPRRTC